MRVLLLVAVLVCSGCGDRVPSGTRGTCYDPAGNPVFLDRVSFMPASRGAWDRYSSFVDPGDELLVLADPAPSNKQDGLERDIEVRVLSGRVEGFVGAIKRRFFIPAR